MKKALATWLILFLTSPLICVAQEVYTTDYEMQYEVEFSMLKNNLNNKQTEVLYLYTSPQASVFVNESADNNQTGNWNSFFQLRVYKNFHNGKVIAIEDLASKNYAYQELDVPLDWRMSGDSKEFSGYKVQKATTSFAGREYIAWFTTEIPIADGPYVFHGLPGLIVELYDTQNHYHFSLVSVVRLEESKDWEIGEVEKVSKGRFKEVKEKTNRWGDTSFDSLSENSNIKVRTSYVDENGNEISAAEFRRGMQEYYKNLNQIELE